MQCQEYDGDAVVVNDEPDEIKGLVLKEVDEDIGDGDCDRDTLMPAECGHPMIVQHL